MIKTDQLMMLNGREIDKYQPIEKLHQLCPNALLLKDPINHVGHASKIFLDIFDNGCDFDKTEKEEMSKTGEKPGAPP